MDQIYPKLGDETADDPFNPYPNSQNRVSSSDIALFLHSSGSTGFPKVMPLTQLGLLEWVLTLGGPLIFRYYIKVLATFFPRHRRF